MHVHVNMYGDMPMMPLDTPTHLPPLQSCRDPKNTKI